LWLDEVYSLVARDHVDEAIDILFRNVDELLTAGAFDRCNDLLRTIDLKRLDTHLLVGLATITLPAASELSFRSALLARIETRLKLLAPERVDRLLAGLR